MGMLHQEHWLMPLLLMLAQQGQVLTEFLLDSLLYSPAS
jgi:hypothetical protein